jgi:hypothetical protein
MTGSAGVAMRNSQVGMRNSQVGMRNSQVGTKSSQDRFYDRYISHQDIASDYINTDPYTKN